MAMQQQIPGITRTDLHLRPRRLAGARARGQPPTALNEGDVLLVPAETIHAVRNVGRGNAAELAAYVVEKGKPFLVVLE